MDSKLIFLITSCKTKNVWPFNNSAATLHLWSPSPAAWPSSSPHLPCSAGAASCLSPDLSVDHESLGRWDCTVATGSYRLHAGGSQRWLGCRDWRRRCWCGRSPGNFAPSSAGPRAGTCLWPEHLSRSCREGTQNDGGSKSRRDAKNDTLKDKMGLDIYL